MVEEENGARRVSYCTEPQPTRITFANPLPADTEPSDEGGNGAKAGAMGIACKAVGYSQEDGKGDY